MNPEKLRDNLLMHDLIKNAQLATEEALQWFVDNHQGASKEVYNKLGGAFTLLHDALRMFDDNVGFLKVISVAAKDRMH